MTVAVDPRVTAMRKRLREDLEFYAPRCLQIVTKKDDAGNSSRVPFTFNEAQKIIHAQLEAQKAEKGWVRAVILKGRQQGCSTYVQARFFHKTTNNRGEKTFILTHQQAATDNLFSMTKRYYDYCPEFVQPFVDKSNSQELSFGRMDSSYQVATAGAKGAGRSATLANVHGSEVAFWENGESHLGGLFQAVALAPGTEIILESTANGYGNVFQKQWDMAVRGESDFIAVFVPWFVSSEYRRKLPEDFQLDGNPESVPEGELTEVDYAGHFKLDNEQMYWRRRKIIEMGGGEEGFFLFKQEYPATADEAFQKSSQGSLLSRRSVFKARKSNVATPGALILGVDPAGDGENSDRTVIIRRRTCRLFGKEVLKQHTIPQIARRVHAIIKAEHPAKVNIDVGGIGLGLYHALAEMPGTHGIIVPVNFGEAAMDPTAFVNRKAEMAWALKEWIEAPGGANIPDDDETAADFLATPPDVPDSNQRRRLKSKQWVKKEFGKSPDIFDASILTMATPVSMEAGRIGNAIEAFDPLSVGTGGGSEYVGNALPDWGWD